MERKREGIDFREDLLKIVGVSEKNKVPYTLVPGSYDGDVRLKNKGRFTKYVAVFSKDEYEKAMQVVIASLPKEMAEEALGISQNIRSFVIEKSYLDNENLTTFLTLKRPKTRNGLYSPVPSDDISNQKKGDWVIVDLKDVAALEEKIDWAFIKDSPAKLIGAVGQDEAKTLFQQFGLNEENNKKAPILERLKTLLKRRVKIKDKEFEKENVIEKERDDVIVTLGGNVYTGEKAKSLEGALRQIGANTDDYVSHTKTNVKNKKTHTRIKSRGGRE